MLTTCAVNARSTQGVKPGTGRQPESLRSSSQQNIKLSGRQVPNAVEVSDCMGGMSSQVRRDAINRPAAALSTDVPSSPGSAPRPSGLCQRLQGLL